MRDPERDLGRLEHILMAIDKIEEYTQGISYAQLVADSMRLHATVYNVQIVGEAAYKLTHEFKASHFWRTQQQQEVDYIEDYDGVLHAYEFKWSTSKQPRLTTTFAKGYPDHTFSVISPDNYQAFVAGTL